MARTTILLAALVVLVVLVGCGAKKPASPEQVARDWSAALDRNDNEAAARLFDTGAQVVQNTEFVFSTHADAVRWNAALPCGGKITSVSHPNATDVLVVFTLENRPQHACDAPGQQAAALFRVRGGKIVLWHQTASPDSPPAPQV
jgi:limonene-1,2-epoxide hydrolase